jgi:hypothetical protein
MTQVYVNLTTLSKPSEVSEVDILAVVRQYLSYLPASEVCSVLRSPVAASDRTTGVIEHSHGRAFPISQVIRVHIPPGKRYGFVTFSSLDAAQNLVAFRTIRINGKACAVQLAKPSNKLAPIYADDGMGILTEQEPFYLGISFHLNCIPFYGLFNYN